MALPSASHLARSNAISQIHGFTPKRLFFKRALRLAVSLGADRLLTTEHDDPLLEYGGIATPRFLAVINAALSNRARTIAVVWPWPPSCYRGRLYVQVFDELGLPLAFTKIALEADQAERLLNEAMMLDALDTSVGSSMRTPALLASGEVDGKVFILAEALPIDLRPISEDILSESLFGELAGELRTFSTRDLVSLSWWPRFFDRLEPFKDVREEVTAGIDRHGLPVCRVHGDFSAKNMLRHHDLLWVVDWETGSIWAPRLVDRLCLWLASFTHACSHDPCGTLENLIAEFGAEDRRIRLEVAAALGYLLANDSAEAGHLLACWT